MTAGDLSHGIEELAGLIRFRIGAWEDFGYAEPPVSACAGCGHGRTAHLTRAPSRPEPYLCSECDCRQYRGTDYATIPPLGQRSASASQAGHDAIRDIDELTRQLYALRSQLIGEMRQDEDLRAARVDALLAERSGGE